MDDTRLVNGVVTRVVWDRVWLDGELIEDTKDWYAQDKAGNVWYFGEDSFEMADGKITSHAGSWEAGVNGAQPGIVMLANPVVGQVYRQEYLAGEAEDMGEVLALGETVTVPYGPLSGCLKTRDYTPLEPGADEHKYYCPEVGFTVLEVGIEDGERMELVSVGLASVEQVQAPVPEEFVGNITEEQAKEIALKEVPGKVTDVAIERKYGKVTYVVEIDPDSGPETDVIIEAATGIVLGVET
jgi:hypothetical protein